MKSIEALCATALLVLASHTAGAAPVATTPCALSAPRTAHAAGQLQVEVDIDCSAGVSNARPFPLGVDLLVGLTVYAAPAQPPLLMSASHDSFKRRVLDAAPEVRSALASATQSTTKVGGDARWLVLDDETAASYDFTAQPSRIAKPGYRVTLRYAVDEKAVTGKQHLLLAVWRASERIRCDKTSTYARSGCRRDGYVIGKGSGVAPIAAYPGMEINYLEGPNDQWTSERWIVERFL